MKKDAEDEKDAEDAEDGGGRGERRCGNLVIRRGDWVTASWVLSA